MLWNGLPSFERCHLDEMTPAAGVLQPDLWTLQPFTQRHDTVSRWRVLNINTSATTDLLYFTYMISSNTLLQIDINVILDAAGCDKCCSEATYLLQGNDIVKMSSYLERGHLRTCPLQFQHLPNDQQTMLVDRLHRLLEHKSVRSGLKGVSKSFSY